jgi:serine/threonine protein kinase
LKNILAGLISMFRFGYSHRDIKSSNICLKNGSCIIIDLGCTKQFSNELGSGFNKSKTMISRVGSIMTKSPEMLRKEKYTYRTDLWAVGILYY